MRKFSVPYPDRDCLAELAQRHDLTLLGIVALEPQETACARMEPWLAAGKHAGMHFLTKHQDVRRDPRRLLPGAQTAVILGFNVNCGDTLTRDATGRDGPRVAQYARFRDYHRLLRERATRLWEIFSAQSSHDCQHDFRVVIDSIPLFERALAAKTAQGFIGKNTCYIHPQLGSWFLLVEILTTLPLPYDMPSTVDSAQRATEGGCGSCRRCQVHCPTGALDQDYTLDARRCLSYWTIEHRGTIPTEFWPHLRKYWFGCDICQLVCPYNRYAPRHTATDVQRFTQLDLYDVVMMSQVDYERHFGGTPLTRAKREGLRRNALIALFEMHDERLCKVLTTLADDPSPLIKETCAQIRAITGRRH